MFVRREPHPCLVAALSCLCLSPGCGRGDREPSKPGSAIEDGSADAAEEDSAGDGDGETEQSAEGSGDSSLPELDEGGSKASDDADGGDDGSELDTPKFDIGFPDESTGEMACEKVDFLFVIDNSGSMHDEQQNLIRSFPGFIAGIRDEIMAEDFHVMVVDTDARSFIGSTQCINGECSCTPFPDCCEFACFGPAGGTCNGVDCDLPPADACDLTLGAGKRYDSLTGDVCQTNMSRRYFRDSDGGLEDAFACAASVGTFGDGNERPIDATLAAVGEQLGAAGACNEGFLRDDALLVVTIITDEEETVEDKSAGNPADWRADLIAAKGGVEEKLVVIGIIGDRDLPNPLCSEIDEDAGTGAEASPRLRDFVTSFGERGLAASVCADDYSPFFVEAVGVIDSACHDIPG